jgi:hypothetical protein
MRDPWGVRPEWASACFHTGNDALDVLRLLNECPISTRARKLLIDKIDTMRTTFPEDRGENFITGRVIESLALDEPRGPLGGRYLFTVEDTVSNDKQKGMQSNNR